MDSRNTEHSRKVGGAERAIQSNFDFMSNFFLYGFSFTNIHDSDHSKG